MRSFVSAVALVLFAVLTCSPSEAQLFRRQLVCGPNGCTYQTVPVQSYQQVQYPVARTVVGSFPQLATRNPQPVRQLATRISPLASPVDFPVESYVVSPIVDLEIQAAEALRIGDRDFVRKVREATNEGRKQGKLSALQQARILAAIRLPRIGKEVEQMIAAEFEVPVSATGLIDWDNFDPDKFLVLIEAILKILLMFGIGG